MREKAKAAAAQETRDEAIGLLTAISIVSKRLAKRLALLERAPEERRNTDDTGDATDSPAG